MAILLSAGAVAFGAVYPWAYTPLFAAAFVIGIACLIRTGGIPDGYQAIAISLSMVVVATVIQLIPMPYSIVWRVSPAAEAVLSRFDIGYAQSSFHALSIEPRASLRALLCLVVLSTFLVGAAAVMTASIILVVTRSLVIVGVLLVNVALIQRATFNGRIYWFWKPEQGIGGGVFGPFVNRNHFAGWLLMVVMLSVGMFCARVMHMRQREVHWRSTVARLGSDDFAQTLLFAAGIVVMMVGLVWTLSRSAIISLLCALGVAIAVVGRRAKGSLLIGAFFVMALAVAVWWRGPDTILNWFGDTTDFRTRLDAWRDAWNVARQFPMAGTGLNTFDIAMIFHQRAVPNVFLSQAHNDYLELAADGGLLLSVPIVVSVSLLIVGIRRCVRTDAVGSPSYWLRVGAISALVGIAVQEVAEFTLQMPANALLMCFAAAVALHKSQH